MKKRIWAALLSALMVLTLVPATASAAEGTGGIILSAEAPEPANGEYFAEGEEIRLTLTVRNSGTETVTALQGGQDGTLAEWAPELAAGEELTWESPSAMTLSLSQEDIERGTKDISADIAYMINDTSYSLSETVTIPVGEADTTSDNGTDTDPGAAQDAAPLSNERANPSYLDFTSQSVPVPGTGDLWAWDETSRTLTLKDGFTLENTDPDQDGAITLPGDSTVIVEGEAKISSEGKFGIVSYGNLTIRGTDPQTSRMEIKVRYRDGEAVSADGNLTVENCAFSSSGLNYLLHAVMDVNIHNARIESQTSLHGISNEYGIYSEKGNISITGGSSVFITDAYMAIISDGGLISITDSNVSVEDSVGGIVGGILAMESNQSSITAVNSSISISETDLGIASIGNVFLKDCDISILGAMGAITVTDETINVDGGRLLLEGSSGVLLSPQLTISENTSVDLRMSGGIIIREPDNTFLSGFICLYDEDTNLLYEGPWDPELCDENGKLMVGGVAAYRLIGMHDHVYDQKVVSGEYLAGAATCTEPARYYYSCVCGEPGTATFADGEPLGHNFQDGVCTLCGIKEADTAAGTAAEGDGKVPQTGDDSSATLWIALICAAGAVFTGTAIFCRKRTKS